MKKILSLITMMFSLAIANDVKEIKDIGFENGIVIGTLKFNPSKTNTIIKFNSCIDRIETKEIKKEDYKVIYINDGRSGWFNTRNPVDNPPLEDDVEYKILIHKEYLEKCNIITMKYNFVEYRLDNSNLVDYVSKENKNQINIKGSLL